MGGKTAFSNNDIQKAGKNHVEVEVDVIMYKNNG